MEIKRQAAEVYRQLGTLKQQTKETRQFIEELLNDDEYKRD